MAKPSTDGSTVVEWRQGTREAQWRIDTRSRIAKERLATQDGRAFSSFELNARVARRGVAPDHQIGMLAASAPRHLHQSHDQSGGETKHQGAFLVHERPHVTIDFAGQQ